MNGWINYYGSAIGTLILSTAPLAVLYIQQITKKYKFQYLQRKEELSIIINQIPQYLKIYEIEKYFILLNDLKSNRTSTDQLLSEVKRINSENEQIWTSFICSFNPNNKDTLEFISCQKENYNIILKIIQDIITLLTNKSLESNDNTDNIHLKYSIIKDFILQNSTDYVILEEFFKKKNISYSIIRNQVFDYITKSKVNLNKIYQIYE